MIRRFFNKIIRTAFILICLVVFLHNDLYSQFNVTDQIPSAYSTTSSSDGTITIFFSQNVNASTLAGGIYISGSVSGTVIGNFSLSSSNTAVFTPSTNFSDGEKISVSVTSNVLATNGASINTPVQWSFRVQPFVGSYEFTSPQIYDLRAGSEPSAVKAIDLTNNSLPDLVVVNSNNSLVTIFQNQDSNDFLLVNEIETGIESQAKIFDDLVMPAATQLPTNSTIASADLNKNGNNDVIIAATLTNQLILLRNSSASTTDLTLEFLDTGERPVEVITGDFNLNGWMDLAVASAGNDQIYIHFNNGNGSFSSPIAINVGLAPTSISAEDINGNGFLDIVILTAGQNQIEALINNGTGSFSRLPLVNNISYTPSFMVTGNFLQNTGSTNYPDIILGSTDNNILYLYENNGSSFVLNNSWSVGNLSRVLTASSGDLNSNGFLDLITSHTNSGNLVINQFPNVGSTISVDNNINTPLGSALADLNLGGSMDIAVTSATNSQLFIYYNTFDAGVCEEILTNISFPSLIDFGTTEIGSTVTRQFQISNNSNVTVGISLSISNGEFFNLDTPNQFSLASNGSRTSTASFTPSAMGNFTDQLNVRLTTICGVSNYTIELRGEVSEPLPDLVAVAVNSTSFETEYFLGVNYNFEGLMRLDSKLPVNSPFDISFIVNSNIENLQRETESIQPNQTKAYQFDYSFSELGLNTITFVVDSNDEIEESNTTNNEVSINITILEGQMKVSPNPFTPNDDGFNDLVNFDFSQLASIANPRIQIFSFNGRLVKTLGNDNFTGSLITWDGKDEDGNLLQPGVYLYIVRNNSDLVKRGSITLAL